jgi:hypothetical protein
MDIKVKSLEHHNFYIRYRLHTANAAALPNNLRDFLTGIFEFIPQELFVHPQNPGCSGMRREYAVELEKSENHEIIALAHKSREHTKFKSRHENLQQWFLLNDPYAIAAEVPVWADEAESKTHLGLPFPLTGHIDLLRFRADKIEIWDFKPHARREKYATIQVLFYALLLSLRTQIPLDKFECGYFDEALAFTFKPLTLKNY